jgi:hypothetical protein
MLRALPPTLNETYDQILHRIKPTHRRLANTALRFIALARQPPEVGLLIEACTAKLDGDDQGREESRLSPAELLVLLRHLVVLDTSKSWIAAGLTSTAFCREERLFFAHFSVMEYLTTPEYMAPDLRPSFAIDLKRGIMTALTVQLLVKVVATAAFSAYNPFSN